MSFLTRRPMEISLTSPMAKYFKSGQTFRVDQVISYDDSDDMPTVRLIGVHSPSRYERIVIFTLQLAVFIACAVTALSLIVFKAVSVSGWAVIALSLGYTGGWCAKRAWTQFFDSVCRDSPYPERS